MEKLFLTLKEAKLIMPDYNQRSMVLLESRLTRGKINSDTFILETKHTGFANYLIFFAFFGTYLSYFFTPYSLMIFSFILAVKLYNPSLSSYQNWIRLLGR